MFQVKVFDQIIGFSTVAASLKNAWNPKQTTDIFMGTAWLHIVTQEFEIPPLTVEMQSFLSVLFPSLVSSKRGIKQLLVFHTESSPTAFNIF